MKIKQRKYLSEKEALNWLVDNSETLLGIEFEKNAYGDKFFGCDFRYDERLGRTEDGRYCITEELEVTEDTVLPRLACVHSKTNNISCYNDISLKRVMGLARFDFINYKLIYLQNPDGSIGELIWTKQKGMVD
ncbi:hypothetical protein ETI10_10535 [Macrococcoides goetzii]|nr:hypothetical protein [Macrococcus goetzii]TDM39872.1 hypothetical protein ETI10_10535 [Macrococcus goetzii]